MTKLQSRAPALLLMLLAGCHETQTAPKFDYGAVLGVAVEKSDRSCLDIRNANLSVGQRIQFVTLVPSPSTGDAEVIRKVEQACTTADQNKPGLYHYDFKLIRGSLSNAAPAFALVNFGGALKADETGVTADIDGDGQLEIFRTCTSSEGVHLTVWTGKPLEGQRKWHYYYFLGYDVAPDCTERDTKPDNS